MKRSRMTLVLAVLLLCVSAVLPVSASAGEVPTVRQLNDEGQMVELDTEDLVDRGILATPARPLSEGSVAAQVAPEAPAERQAGYVSGSLYPSALGCGVALKGQASGWGSGSGTIEVTLYYNGVLQFNDSRDFSGSYGSFPLTDITCGPGSFELFTNVVHTNGADTHVTSIVVAC